MIIYHLNERVAVGACTGVTVRRGGILEIKLQIVEKAYIHYGQLCLIKPQAHNSLSSIDLFVVTGQPWMFEAKVNKADNEYKKRIVASQFAPQEGQRMWDVEEIISHFISHGSC